MSTRIKLAAAAAVAALLATTPLQARDRDWVVLGEQTVGLDVDRDLVTVPRAARFKTIKLEAERADVHVMRVKLIYENGYTEEFRVDETISAGRQSRPIDLRGERSYLKQIELLYKTKTGSRTQGVIRVVAEGAYADAGPAPGHHGAGVRGFDVLETKTVRLSEDEVTLPVGREDGKFSAIALRALDNALDVRRAEIVFGNGDRQEVRIGDQLSPGELSSPIDLDGDKRRIREVVVRLRPQASGGVARLQVLGKRSEGRPEVGGGGGGGRPPFLIEQGVPKGWIMFGMQPVGAGVDRDVIKVGSHLGVFDKIALLVNGADVLVREIVVHFANGERDRIEVNAVIPGNHRTRPIALDGKRRLDRIELVYQATRPGNAGKSVVQVYGEYAQAWLGGQHPDRPRDGWLLLGAQKAQMLAADSDVFELGERYGRFRSVRVTAREHAVKIYGMRIVYSNGTTEEVPMMVELGEGQTTPPFDLQGRERHIDRIELRYRTKLNFQGEGTVEIWGQR